MRQEGARPEPKSADDKRRQAARFELSMGLEGSGSITLAEGLEDVEVSRQEAATLQLDSAWRRTTDTSHVQIDESGQHGRRDTKRRSGGEAAWSSDDSGEDVRTTTGESRCVFDARSRESSKEGGGSR